MDDKTCLQMITELSNARGVSGFEDEVLAVARKYAGSFVETKEDSIRNLYLHRPQNTGNKPVMMLDAHSDEVGFMVQMILPNGTLHFVPLGGWTPNTVPAHKVWVRVRDGSYIPGIVASKPPHFTTDADRSRPLSLADMVIDVGASSKEEAAERFGVRIGEPVVPAVTFKYDGKNDCMLGKAFDCRVGCAALIATMERLREKELRIDVEGALSAQEEVGDRGIRVTSRVLHPDIAIVFEGCPADDTFTPDYGIQTAIRKGPMLRFIDREMISNPRYMRWALDLAEKKGIPVQSAVRSGGATNGAVIHTSGKSVPVIVIGIPVRYIHSHHGFASFQDFKASVELACAVIENLDAAQIESF